jgi:hypothetical protein
MVWGNGYISRRDLLTITPRHQTIRLIFRAIISKGPTSTIDVRNCRTPDSQFFPIQLLIGRLYIHLVVWLFAILCGYFWHILWIHLGCFWDTFRIHLGYYVDADGVHFGYILETFWILFGYFWDTFRTPLGYFWVSFRIVLGYFRVI